MGRIIPFTKMQGLGNDYIYVYVPEHPIADPAAFSKRWSDRRTGIGSDGLILIGSSDVADFSMRIFNADGSEARMCGNGSRCVGRYVFEKGLTNKTHITLETLSGVKTLTLHPDGSGAVRSVSVGMGPGVPMQVALPGGETGTFVGGRASISTVTSFAPSPPVSASSAFSAAGRLAGISATKIFPPCSRTRRTSLSSPSGTGRWICISPSDSFSSRAVSPAGPDIRSFAVPTPSFL